MQRIIIKKLAEEYGYLYSYILAHLEEKILDKETQWVDETVRSFLRIPLQEEFPKLSPTVAERYVSVSHT